MFAVAGNAETDVCLYSSSPNENFIAIMSREHNVIIIFLAEKSQPKLLLQDLSQDGLKNDNLYANFIDNVFSCCFHML